MGTATLLTTMHWGTYEVRAENGRLVGVEPWSGDPDPSPIGRSMLGTVQGELRVARPSIRRSWLEGDRSRPVQRRSDEPFIEVPWETALDIVAAELDRVRSTHGNSAIYAGSYGWASAGRFHHAQGQVHRFLNTIGGYTGSVLSYSYGAAEIILPHVLGSTDALTGNHTTWDEIEQHSKLIVAFGGLPWRNTQVQGGGSARHEASAALQNAVSNGARLINVSPVRDDAPRGAETEWLSLRPNSDTAVMLALCHVLIREGLHDEAFLARYCTGFDIVRAYVMGESDGQPKDSAWAAKLSGVDAATIDALARDMAANRTMLMVSWSLQRADHGEQPYWAAITLAALLGQIGLPGGGIGFGYSSTNGAGRPEMGFRWPSVPQGRNAVAHFIPVARMADMLLNPGGSFDFNGAALTYPDIRLVYWAGGNPFHHHQDLNRLVEAWQRPETVIVNEQFWTATARHADIVLPVTTALERNDVAFSNRENLIVAMKQAIDPFQQARDDFAIFADLATRLGTSDAFTEGRGAGEWIRHLYGQAVESASVAGVEMPPFDRFWHDGHAELARSVTSQTFLGSFRADPERNPLATPSGRIELFSATVESFGYDDCPGHAVWREPREWLGNAGLTENFPLHLLSPQPADKLHSQYDHGSVSRTGKVSGRAPLLINREDAAARGIVDGAVVKVFNDRGSCLAGAVLSDSLIPGVVQLPTGAWFDPARPGEPQGLEKHGNPNVLTPDRGTSRLAQSPTCNSTLVQVSRFAGTLPPVTAFDPPATIDLSDASGLPGRRDPS
ncbi:molybdopterin guanine dinucleotide-containing S/N-oxide reductase [Mesorhizobium sp. VK25A]|uniref:Molybdopterin guanine dinucleotide-containing S/N-oxide reductase n=1 Tax=Mesorhizobium vachelliae TaxID=3072309 RepID=A0ABU5A316_9HYPH|nr:MULTISPECIES: molybdopterin guanine dinucleotide-containing S/N-oxide reductase [unclassified Mesorhizobium]MDX8530919.1 molybdopterin guanine dinucleotide-containing S/N-oxide reductase [Mesorhizobium sp. VK25D]MDX8543330.1 molybdopterin guanine dinucleotide-containing S/N-oxide reductase [Mesorhizobium sp. VK25A]